MIELIEHDGKESKRNALACEIREKIAATLTEIFSAPHVPVLTEEERGRALVKLAWLLANEYRVAFWCLCGAIADLTPGTTDNPTRLTPTVLKWAGRKSGVPKYRERTPKAKHAENGRVIKTGKSL